MGTRKPLLMMALTSLIVVGLTASCELLSVGGLKDVVDDVQTSLVKLTGRIEIDPNAVASGVKGGMMVVAQVVGDGAETLRAFTDLAGNFNLEIPDSLKGSDFILSLVDAQGRALGPIIDAAQNAQNSLRPIGMALKEGINAVDFGAVQVAANGLISTASTPAGLSAVPGLVARVDASGLPVGVGNFGKGEAAKVTGVLPSGSVIDKDQDGLIDLVDADDDGDGILDDFDPDAVNRGMPEHHQIQVGFWLNPTDQEYRLFYQPDADVREYVKSKYILELWYNIRNPSEAATVGAISLDTRNRPGYTDVLQSGPENNPAQLVNWSQLGWGLDPVGVLTTSEGGYQWKKRLTVQQGAKADLKAGDVFTFAVKPKDPSQPVRIVSQMLNFVFTNIPLLRYIGTDPNNLRDFSAIMAASQGNGTPFDGSVSTPLVIADNQDLLLKFQPPTDDLGLPILQGSYKISVLAYKPGGGQVWNWDQRTWNGTAPAGWYNNNHVQLEVPVTESSASFSYNTSANQFTVRVPQDVLPDQVWAQGETSAFVPDRFSIGIISLVKESQVAFTVFVKKP